MEGHSRRVVQALLRILRSGSGPRHGEEGRRAADVRIARSVEAGRGRVLGDRDPPRWLVDLLDREVDAHESEVGLEEGAEQLLGDDGLRPVELGLGLGAVVLHRLDDDVRIAADQLALDDDDRARLVPAGPAKGDV